MTEEEELMYDAGLIDGRDQERANQAKAVANDRIPIFTGLKNATNAAQQNGKMLGKLEMKKEILDLLKDRKRIDDALLKKIEEMKCH
jgi:hypothetical protein